jgi:hypothetical protein
VTDFADRMLPAGGAPPDEADAVTAGAASTPAFVGLIEEIRYA